MSDIELAFSILLASVTLAGCSGNVVVDGAGTTTGAGGSTATTGTGATSTSTTFPGTTVTTGTTVASSSSSSSSGSSCVGSIQLVTDNAGTATLSSMCSGAPYNPTGATSPIGYVFAGGPAPGTTGLNVVGCADEATDAQGLFLSVNGATGTGTFMTGQVQYLDAMGQTENAVSGSLLLVVGEFGAVGQTIEGKFEVTTQTQGPAIILHKLAGSFQVCHVPDELVP